MPKYDSPPSTTPYTVTPHYAGQRNVVSTRSVYNPFFTGPPKIPPANQGRISPSGRQDIIRKIKSTESAPLSNHEEFEGDDHHLSDRDDKGVTREQRHLFKHVTKEDGQFFKRQDEHRMRDDGHFFKAHDGSSTREMSDQNALGLDISRPRSALHKGDFREHAGPGPHPSTSPVVPWHHAFPSAASTAHDWRVNESTLPLTLPARSRALSHASLSTSFTYQPPTSPLVHQSNAADIPDHHDHHINHINDFSDESRHHAVMHNRQNSPDRASRRHTYSPHQLHHSISALHPTATSKPGAPRHAALLRRDANFPCQAHQPRRSVASCSSLPQTPYLSARRPSISDASPLQHAPMVGSYEESILRGRMSTTPSKPLDFVAQIGVLGKGDCKPSLKCPSHITVPFPAVFYSYPSAMAVDPEPSPYVGMIDLDHHLANSTSPDPSRKRFKHRGHSGNQPNPQTDDQDERTDMQARKRKHQRPKRATSPKEPPGGSYRIPQQGQLQIVLKNPNKTAVKLFLVPYDLSDMEPGQKTFIRQRSYSAGPIIDMPVNSRTNYGTDRPEAALSAATDPKDRPILRYLIHLHICCPSRNRYYLYQNIRVVFANRVPDGKEKLRSEIQMPEPRYTTYKPSRETHLSIPSTDRNVANRRRSDIFPAVQARSYGAESMDYDSYGSSCDGKLFVKSLGHAKYPFANGPRLPTLESRPSSRGLSSDGNMESDDQETPSPLTLSHQSTGLRISNLYPLDQHDGGAKQDSLLFSRDSSRERSPSIRAESLLSRRLKDLEMQNIGGRNGE